MAYCGKCLHLDVCKSAETCDGHVPRCKHFMDKTKYVEGENYTEEDVRNAYQAGYSTGMEQGMEKGKDAAVKHGRWIAVPSSDMMTGKAYKCSKCGKMRYGSFVPNYCQNCGAKMDGDGQ